MNLHSNVTSTQRFSTFTVDNLLFGIDVLKVQEVLRCQEITKVPLAPPEVEGLINLRGQIVTAINARRLLQLPARTQGAKPMNMVIRRDGAAVSLLVDDIGDVIEVASDLFEPAPDNMPRSQTELLEGVFKLDGRLLLVLNTDFF
jgi:purine-binding chemotaxis protein CheW